MASQIAIWQGSLYYTVKGKNTQYINKEMVKYWFMKIHLQMQGNRIRVNPLRIKKINGYRVLNITLWQMLAVTHHSCVWPLAVVSQIYFNYKKSRGQTCAHLVSTLGGCLLNFRRVTGLLYFGECLLLDKDDLPYRNCTAGQLTPTAGPWLQFSFNFKLDTAKLRLFLSETQVINFLLKV